MATAALRETVINVAPSEEKFEVRTWVVKHNGHPFEQKLNRESTVADLLAIIRSDTLSCWVLSFARNEKNLAVQEEELEKDERFEIEPPEISEVNGQIHAQTVRLSIEGRDMLYVLSAFQTIGSFLHCIRALTRTKESLDPVQVKFNNGVDAHGTT